MGRNQDRVYYKRFYGDIKGKVNEKPYILLMRKEAEGYQLKKNESWDKDRVVYKETGLNGILVSVKSTNYLWKEKDKIVHQVEITLRDHKAKEDYVITCAYSQMGISLINGLLNLETFGEMGISVYQDDKGFNKLSLKCNNEWSGYKVEYKEYEPLIRKYLGKEEKEERDYTKVYDYFRQKLEVEVLPKVAEYVRNSNNIDIDDDNTSQEQNTHNDYQERQSSSNSDQRNDQAQNSNAAADASQNQQGSTTDNSPVYTPTDEDIF